MKEFINNIGNWFINNWLSIIKVIAIILVGVIIIKLILALVKRNLKKSKVEKTVQGFILSILKFVFYLVLICCVISGLGISITGLTVVISAISLAVSLALQDSLKNLVNGFVIISTKLVKEGDWVKIGDYEGSVIDVRMLYTVLKTADNKKITIPNSSIIGSQITNYNIYKSRRLDLDFEIAYNSNVDLAKKIMLDVANSCKEVFDNPSPQTMLSSLNQSSITVKLRIWCASEDYWNIKWYLIDNVFNEFKRNNITIPFNQLEVALVDPNKETYVRSQGLQKVENHKKLQIEENDIITSFNKGFKNAQIKEKEFRDKIKNSFKKKENKGKEKQEIDEINGKKENG